MNRCFSAVASCLAICLLLAGCSGNRAGSDSKPRGSAGSGRSCGTTGNPAGINTFQPEPGTADSRLGIEYRIYKAGG